MTKNFCYYCKAEATKKIRLEKHHVFGKVNSEMWVFLCLNCHNHITKLQNVLPPRVRSKNANGAVRKIYAMYSGAAHLKKFGEEQMRLCNELIEEYKKNGHNVRKSIPKKTG